MNLLRTIIKRDQMYVDPMSTIMSQTFAMDGNERVLPNFTSYAQGGYAGNSVVFSVILARLMLFSEARFKFRTLSDKRLFGNPDLTILEHPWPGATTGELLARMEQDVSLSGNSFTRVVGDGTLERLRPDRVMIVSAEDEAGFDSERVVGYAYDCDGTGKFDEFYDVSEVAHWSPIPDPLCKWRGMSWLTPVVREINADVAMTAHRQSFFANAATPNMILKYSQSLQPEKAQQLAARFQERHGGPDKAWRTVVLDDGADLSVVGSSFKDMDFSAVQAAGETRIAGAGGVPPIVAGLSEGLATATYSNYEQAMRRFADLTMRPLWRSAAAALAKLVNVPAGSELWYDVTDIAALRQGEQERATTMATQASAASTLLTAGYEADSIVAALVAGDMTLLKHTGLISVQLIPNGLKAIKDELAAGQNVGPNPSPPVPPSAPPA